MSVLLFATEKKQQRTCLSTLQLRARLNSVEFAVTIKFTYEEETVGQIPFVNTLLVRKEDGNIKFLS